MKSTALPVCLTLAGIFACAELNTAQAQVVTYQFNNTFASDQTGQPALTANDPLGSNAFEDATVFGQMRRVYHTVGNGTPSQQSGLTLDTTGLIPANNYSVVLVTQTIGASGWRRLIDVQNRQSDNGFYVDPNNHLDVYPVAAGTTPYTAGDYHVVTLTDSNSGTVNAYLDGSLEFTANTTVMDINNPGNLLNFYLDNVVGGGIGEYSDARTALIEVYDRVLSSSEVTTLSANPFPAAVPEPGAIALGMGMLVTGAGFLRRKSSR